MPRGTLVKAVCADYSREMLTGHHHTRDLDQHVALIKGQVDKSMRDGDVRQLAVKIVSGVADHAIDPRTGESVSVIRAFGKQFLAPPGAPCPARDDGCEIERIWDFVVLNFRYVYDPAEIDTFATARESLLAGGGDCFPVGTLVLRDDGRMVPIEQIAVGDFIHDGTGYVEVLKTWDRGEKPIVNIGLNNGDTLRLSDTHKVLRVPRHPYVNPNTGKVLTALVAGRAEDAEECRVQELQLGDELLQPREFGGGAIELSDDDAFLVGAYLAEGCKIGKRKRAGEYERLYAGIAGVASGKGIRERVLTILKTRGVEHHEYEREIRFKVADVPILADLDLGHDAHTKHLPHLNWGPRTVAGIVAAMEQGDGGVASNGANMVYSTVSAELALQYRVLKRMLGCSLSRTCLAEHGGFGAAPIHRLTVRVSDKQCPWARVTKLTQESTEGYCVDVMTASGRVYLPEADVVVRQCDDSTILFAALAGFVGFRVVARVIATKDNPKSWAHIYPLIGISKDEPVTWVPLDCTVEGASPGWEYEGIANYRDYQMV